MDPRKLRSDTLQTELLLLLSTLKEQFEALHVTLKLKLNDKDTFQTLCRYCLQIEDELKRLENKYILKIACIKDDDDKGKRKKYTENE